MSKKERVTVPTLPQMNSVNRVVNNPIVRLCQNDIINLDQYFASQESQHLPRYDYCVTSEQIILLAISFQNVPLLPPEMENKLKGIHQIQSYKFEERSDRNDSCRTMVCPQKYTHHSIFANGKINRNRNAIDHN